MYKANKSMIARASAAMLGISARSNKFGEGDSVPINQNPSQSFNVNPDTGRPMSVITSLLRSQNAAEQMAILNGLDEFKSDYLPEGISNEDAIKFMMPRYCQLPSQISDFAGNLKAEKDLLELKKKNNEELSKKVDEPASASSAGGAEPAPASSASA